MDTNDYCATPQQLKDQLSDRYPEARCAHLKSGGDFPFLSRPDEVNLHLQLHLRRVGLEAQPDMVRGIPKDGAGGSHGEEKDGKEDPDDEPKDDEGSSEGQSKENQLCPAPESSESHTSHDQPLSNAQLCLISPGDTIHLCFLRKQHVIAIEIFFQYTLETFLRLASLSREVDVHHFIFWAKTQTNGVK